MSQDAPRQGKHWEWLLVGLVLLATAAGLVGLWQKRRPAPARNPEQAAAAERAAAQADLDAVDARVVDALAAHKAETVVDDLWAVVRRHPDFPAARNALAIVLARAGRAQDAYAQYRKSLELNNQQVEVHLNAGNLAWMLSDYPRAGKHFDDVLRLDPQNPRGLLRRADFELTRPKADAAAWQRDLALAMVDLNKLLNTDRHEDYEHYGFEAWALMADVMARQNNPVAVEKIDRALAETPLLEHRSGGKYDGYLRKKAALLCQFNRFQEALAALQALDTQAKLDPEVVEQMAVCQMMLGHPDAAAREYAAALAVSNLDSTTPDLRLLTGAARWALKAGDKDAARGYLATLRALSPASPDLPGLEKQLRN
jgi:tetratricopeptide (TPR) repeat protein